MTTIWKPTKKLKRPQITIPPIRKADRSWAKSDTEKATTFMEHFEQVLTPLSNINLNDSEIENFLEIPYQMSLPIKPFSPREVVQEIKHINQYKAPGYILSREKYLENYQEKH
jgi:hypothetical protein